MVIVSTGTPKSPIARKIMTPFVDAMEKPIPMNVRPKMRGLKNGGRGHVNDGMITSHLLNPIKSHVGELPKSRLSLPRILSINLLQSVLSTL